MFKKSIVFLTVILTVTCQHGCSRAAKSISNTKVLYSGALIKKYHLTTDDLKALQFYLAGPVTLTRQVARDYKVGNSMGKLVERDGIMLEEIHIPAGTPGLYLDTQNQGYGLFNMGSRQVHSVSFHPGTSFNFTWDSEGYFPMLIDSNGNVTFNERIDNKDFNNFYKLYSPVHNTRLTVDEDTLSKVEKKRKTLEGVKLPGSQ